MMKKINIITLGCSKNIYDSELILGGLKKNDFIIVDEPVDADYVIVNTCGFLDSAREESIDYILDVEELRKANKIESLIVAGCMSERFAKDLKKELKYVDCYFGTDETSKIIEYICANEYADYDPDFKRMLLTPSHYGYLKISEGCDNGCSFCSIPLMRGLQKSQPIEWNVQEAKRMVANGVKELLVIAQDSTAYGWDLRPKVALSDLLYSLNEIEDLKWIRLHYSHPAHLQDKLINCFKNLDKLTPYIDMPIQHASNDVLRDMRRGLKIDGIKRKIDKIRKINPDIAIRTSMIVGFPNENDDDFLKLCNFIKDVEFDRLGVFVYSEEQGTHGADAFEDNVPYKIKKERLDELMSIQQNINFNKNKSLVGTIQEVVIDINTEDGKSIGRTFRDSPDIDNTIVIDRKLNIGEFYDVSISKCTNYSLIGKVS
ncbi:MAG: 30S ribosomal protein S12 methylthiotransferase RimO [Candidatus Marinimicrobia bacterium]|nr:30S ribosomal protein S12 methylthiotransferase RimO [Candidatus Neomarinimicrobiota bacterium]